MPHKVKKCSSQRWIFGFLNQPFFDSFMPVILNNEKDQGVVFQDSIGIYERDRSHDIACARVTADAREGWYAHTVISVISDDRKGESIQTTGYPCQSSSTVIISSAISNQKSSSPNWAQPSWLRFEVLWQLDYPTLGLKLGTISDST
eukprot:Gb_34941 [translate_table: standard]